MGVDYEAKLIWGLEVEYREEEGEMLQEFDERGDERHVREVIRVPYLKGTDIKLKAPEGERLVDDEHNHLLNCYGDGSIEAVGVSVKVTGWEYVNPVDLEEADKAKVKATAYLQETYDYIGPVQLLLGLHVY